LNFENVTRGFPALLRKTSFNRAALERSKMSSSLTELEPKTGTQVATVDVSDALTQYADTFAPQYIIGKMLRFSKGDWLVGDGTVEPGTTFTVNADEFMAGWIKWLANKPVEHLMVRVIDGVVPKLRPQLGDNDRELWETDKDGKPKDPWTFTNYLPLLDDKRELFTFTTSSRGGIGAVAKLMRLYARHRKRHPDVFPLIKIGVDSYQHKDRNLGRIKFPVFEPAGYVPKADFLAALAEGGFTTAEYPAAETVDDDEDFKMDDSIPF
jgi:hypothetical protein